MVARPHLPPGPPTFDHVSWWLELASSALYARSDDDLEELVIELERARIDLLFREVRAVPEVPVFAPVDDDSDLIDEDPDDDEVEPFESGRRVVLDRPHLNLRLAQIRDTGRW
jgi:hypothetical protein